MTEYRERKLSFDGLLSQSLCRDLTAVRAVATAVASSRVDQAVNLVNNDESQTLTWLRLRETAASW